MEVAAEYSMFNLRDRRSNIVTKHLSSATQLILKPTVWKGSTKGGGLHCFEEHLPNGFGLGPDLFRVCLFGKLFLFLFNIKP